MVDLISEIILFLLGVTISIIQLVNEARGKSRKIYLISLCLVICLFIVLGIRKSITDYQDRKSLNEHIITIGNQLQRIQIAKSNDSLKSIRDSVSNVEFQKKLFDQFGIIRDSNKNSPVQYNTTIKEARDVYIGGK